MIIVFGNKCLVFINIPNDNRFKYLMTKRLKERAYVTLHNKRPFSYSLFLKNSDLLKRKGKPKYFEKNPVI